MIPTYLGQRYQRTQPKVKEYEEITRFDTTLNLSNMFEIEKLLLEVESISKRYEHIARITGENFNIFKTLGVQSSEVRLHSALLAELLNARGSHGQSDKYLKLFLKQLEINEFDTISSEALVEYYSGKISENGELGGRIDILITDKNGKHIIIENKIYAGDQPTQLTRYNNFDQNAELLYLNLFGEKPTDNSCYGLTLGKNYKIISYQKDILSWLDTCMKESASLPIIRETIHQYINLIKKLTNQTTFNTMNNELKEILIKNPSYFKNIPVIYSAYTDLVKDVKEKLFKRIQNRLNEGDFELDIINKPPYKIQLHAGEDSTFYLAFRLVNESNTKRCNLKEDEIVTRSKDKSGLFNEYTQILKETNNSFKSSDWSLAWYSPLQFSKGLKLENDYETFLSLLDDNNMDNFIEKILDDASNIFLSLKNKVKQPQLEV